MFLRNYWYAVTLDHEIKRAPFGRIVCGEAIVLYRQTSGALSVFEDCCPHRLLPLSKGFLEGDRLVCKYHGLKFNALGDCVWMPGHEGIHKDTKLRTYPVAEKHRLVWVWIGDPTLAREETIPDLRWCSDPDWVFEGSTYHINDPPPFWAANLKSFEKCDRWQICNFSLLANVMIDVGVALAGSGAPQGERSKGVTGIVVDLMTPETETSTWYHWGMARNFQTEDRGLTFRIRDGQAAVFTEDLEILEAQQANILSRPDRGLLSLKIDAGGVHARRIIERELAHSAKPRR
jgi:vanillate monooxygenase